MGGRSALKPHHFAHFPRKINETNSRCIMRVGRFVGRSVAVSPPSSAHRPASSIAIVRELLAAFLILSLHVSPAQVFPATNLSFCPDAPCIGSRVDCPGTLACAPAQRNYWEPLERTRKQLTLCAE